MGKEDSRYDQFEQPCSDDDAIHLVTVVTVTLLPSRSSMFVSDTTASTWIAFPGPHRGRGV